MSTLEIELQALRERNNELVKKVQYWKMTAAQRENEKLDLMKENNDLRLKLSRLRSGGAAHARKLDAEIQAASKQALTQLVQASSAVTRTVQLVKTYMQERQDMEASLPRWSSISNTPSTEKVHRVLPMLIGGQSIQPVVSLSRTMVNVNNSRTNRSPTNSGNHNFSERGPLPMHMLQDLYIPLTRIDANGLPVNGMDVDADADNADMDNSAEDLGLDDSGESSLHESQNLSDAEQFNDTRRLEVVEEDPEPEDEVRPAPKSRTENPLEGPSWLLDRISKSRISKSRVALEPDSTTECDQPSAPAPAPAPALALTTHYLNTERAAACEFSPTVRRRKRTASPRAPRSPRTPRTPRTPHAFSPRPAARRNSNSGRILKVLVSKLRLEEEDVSPAKRPSLSSSPSSSPSRPREAGSPVTSPTRRVASRDKSRDRSPARRLSRDVLLAFDAPSPNGATTSHVVISEPTSPFEDNGSGEPAVVARRISKHDNRASRDTKHDSHMSRDTKHDSRASRDTRHDSRDTKHDSRDTKHDSRDTKHDSRDTKHDSRTSREVRSESRGRDTKHDSRDTKHDSRDTKHDSRTSREVRSESRGRDTKHDSRDTKQDSRDTKHDSRTSREVRSESRGSEDSKPEGRGSHDSDSGSGSEPAAEGRTRRARKAVTYKEKPLNRKMRR